MENAHNSQSVFSPNSPTTGAIRHKSRTLPLVLIIINSFATLLVTIFGIILPLINDATHTSRTIMLYMAGSDLESTSGLASADLESINYADAAKNNVRVVAIIGGSKHWYNNYISDDETSYYELTDNGFEKVKQNPRLDMGEPETLSDFLTYAYQNSETPAEQPSSQPAQPAANPYNQPNCTTAWGELTLINPVFTVDTNYIAKRKSELINLTATYDIRESGSNGTPIWTPSPLKDSTLC